jgi:hypothetical protein
MTIFEQEIFNDIATDYIQQFKKAIETKEIERKYTKRKKDGSINHIRFSSVVNASGKLANSPRIELSETELNIFVAGYIDDLIYGKPPSKVELFEIEKWMKSKGFEEDESIAELMVRNIEDFGSSIFRKFQGANSGLLDDIDLTDSISKAKKDLILKKINDITHAFNTK